MHALTEGINDNEDDHGERAPQEPPGLSRLVTSEIKKVVKFRTNREYWDSLPVVSKLFMFMSLIDVCMVIGYVIWQVLEVCAPSLCLWPHFSCVLLDGRFLRKRNE